MWSLVLFSMVLFVFISFILIGVNAFGASGAFASVITSLFPILGGLFLDNYLNDGKSSENEDEDEDEEFDIIEIKK